MASCLTNQFYNTNYVEPNVSNYPELKKFYDGDIFYYPSGFYKDPSKELIDYYIPFFNLSGLRLVTGHFSYGIHNYIQSETRYITLLRDPVERVISLYYHLLNTDIINKKVSLEQFLEGISDESWLVDLTKWYPVNPGFDENVIRNTSKCLVDNDQTRRISGIEPPFGQCNEAMFTKACQNIIKKFALVGLTEKFDETLLLLNHFYQWREQIYYSPRLVNKRKPKTDKIPKNLLLKIDQINCWDRKLYNFARDIFLQKIEESGPGFQKELNEFRISNKKYNMNNQNISDWNI